MNTIHLLFGLLVLMGVTVVFICLADEVPQGQGFAHSSYPAKTIQQAPDGYERHRGVVWAAGVFGTLVSLFPVVCMILGLSTRVSAQLGPRVLLAIGGIYSALFASVVVVYWRFVDGAEPPLLLGFPLSTALMLFVFALSPMGLVLLYMAKFDRWILTPEDAKRFDAIVLARRDKKQGA